VNRPLLEATVEVDERGEADETSPLTGRDREKKREKLTRLALNGELRVDGRVDTSSLCFASQYSCQLPLDRREAGRCPFFVFHIPYRVSGRLRTGSAEYADHIRDKLGNRYQSGPASGKVLRLFPIPELTLAVPSREETL